MLFKYLFYKWLRGAVLKRDEHGKIKSLNIYHCPHLCISCMHRKQCDNYEHFKKYNQYHV